MRRCVYISLSLLFPLLFIQKVYVITCFSYLCRMQMLTLLWDAEELWKMKRAQKSWCDESCLWKPLKILPISSASNFPAPWAGWVAQGWSLVLTYRDGSCMQSILLAWSCVADLAACWPSSTACWPYLVHGPCYPACRAPHGSNNLRVGEQKLTQLTLPPFPCCQVSINKNKGTLLVTPTTILPV